MRHFLDLLDLSPDELLRLLSEASRLKAAHARGESTPVLLGKVLGMVFEKPSLRTRVSFQAAIAQLGGASVFLPGSETGLGSRESVPDFARVMSQYEFDKTLVFIAFAGEEQGLIGSTLLSAKARKENQVIEAMLNNDIVGYDVTGAGRAASGYVNVFSDEPSDSPSRELARYVRDCAQLYVPGFGAAPV